MFRKQQARIKKQIDLLTERLSTIDIAAQQREYAMLQRQLKEYSEIMAHFQQYQKLQQDKADLMAMAEEDESPEFIEEAKGEAASLDEAITREEETLKALLVPRDPDDGKNAILEIRAGTGGDEASLFAADLFKMYARFMESRRCGVEILSSHATGVGGFKEIISLVKGNNAFGTLKFESGVHRVQRIPETETQGRIHTSAVTVAVLPEADEIDVSLNNKDLRIDVFRSTGPGGQSVNTTDSAVRITHVPSGIVVTCQDEKSQHKNKAKAIKVLYARLLQAEKEKQRTSIASKRKEMVGSGDRSERIRTYNFPQNRVTDHRINLTLYKLQDILQGALTDLVQALQTKERELLLAESGQADPDM